MPVRGAVVDEQTRCAHYASALDVVAIRFYCCREYYPCHQCHAEAAGHPAQTWPRELWDQPAVLCGVCHSELAVAEYLDADSRCPRCSAAFNPGCSLHQHLYFG
ncbi:CHY zinc finger protein [Zhihengliuella somnathii]